MEVEVRISEEVHRAVLAGHPVVALESTVLAHGLPRPRNLDVGRALESEVRDGGAVAATVGVVGGVPKVGLSAAELERLATGDAVRKVSTRDLPLVAARREDGATTVAATCRLADIAGVEVFATGGIGGVHRGEPRDVSADITELGQTPMVVVCAGAKAILDLPATLEALETANVLVLGWQTDEFPGFYTRETGLPVDEAVDSAAEVAAIWRAQRSLKLPGSLLVCVPPPEEEAMRASELERAISSAVEAAARDGVRGRELTPHLLRAVSHETGGRALDANTALLRNNARVAATIARAVCER